MKKEKLLLNEQESISIEWKEIEEGITHHTYQDERHVFESIKEGNVKEIVSRMQALMPNAGMMSDKAVNQQKNLAIVVTALSTREAIAGGVHPSQAYRLSDIYMNKIDKAKTIQELFNYTCRVALEFTKLVAEKNERKKHSSYTEKCKDYIHKYYHQKIQIKELAAGIGVSCGHLSRTFRKDTGMSIQEYIQETRVKRAANLLKYSEASLSEISEYVCFHSQSHFGQIFKKYMHMTPKIYRETYKEKEFCSKK